MEHQNRLSKAAVEYLWRYTKLHYITGVTWTALEVVFPLNRTSGQMISYGVYSVILWLQNLCSLGYLDNMNVPGKAKELTSHQKYPSVSSISEKSQMFIRQVQGTRHSERIFM